MFNRRSNENAYESEQDKAYKAQLLANGGMFFRFYGYVETPDEYLQKVIERRHSFEKFSHKEVEWFDGGSCRSEAICGGSMRIDKLARM